MLNKQFRFVTVHAANILCKMALLHALRSSIADKYFCSRHQLTDIFWTKLLWERNDTFPVTFRRQLKGGTPLETGREKFRPRETRLPPLLWIDVLRIVRGITLLVVANTVAMNISLWDFANACGQEERSEAESCQ